MSVANENLKTRLQDDMKASMRAGEKTRLGTIRLILSAIKQIEVDERIELDNTRILAILDKMVKQRRESIGHFEKAARQDLIDIEQAELVLIQSYLPEPLSEADILGLIDAVIAETGASSAKDMGKVMALLKPRLQGRADIGQVSTLIKTKLA
ncbi:MAG: GatB/YqeY domain-containing protein [Gammaproteobacteria bacterium]|nr:GatB/YqeY domain-containing protein [Gammaproteobacteria bacterium]